MHRAAGRAITGDAVIAPVATELPSSTEIRMSSLLRVAVVTLGLMLAGAVFGALAGAVAAAIGLGITNGIHNPVWGAAVAVAAAVGAFLGGVLFPITGMLFMRRVPLGLAVAGAMLGTMAGGLAAWVVHPGAIEAAVTGGILGYAVAVLALRWRFSAARVGVPAAG